MPEDEATTEDTKTVRVLKDSKSVLSERDWTGLISVMIIAGYIVLAAISGMMGVEIPELAQIGTAAAMVVSFYIGRKTK